MKASEFRCRLLMGLYKKANRNGLGKLYDLESLAAEAGLTWSPGQLRLAAEALHDEGLIKAGFLVGGSDKATVMIQHAGLEEAEDLLGEQDAFNDVPASDRYVSFDDNQKASFEHDLATLKEEIRGSNEPSEEERLIALSEIAAFEATIIQPRVSTDLIQRFVDKVLKWVVVVFLGALIAEVAQRIVEALLRLGS